MIYVLLILLGLCFGSFVTALTWRMHEKKNFVTGRSQCESCNHELGALDLMPVISWALLRGKCRYCGASISWQNPVIELTMVFLFVASYVFWPYSLNSWQAFASLGIWLIDLVLLMALAVYDLRWMLLPNPLVFILVGLGLVDTGLRLSIMGSLDLVSYVSFIALGVAALGGVYWLIYTASKGNWVGYGDIKLGAFIGIVLGWQQSLVVLFLANMIGLIAILPILIRGKLSLKSHVPFGPFLIVAFIITGLFGARLINWYVSLILPT